jgi:phosphoglycerate kinase
MKQIISQLPDWTITGKTILLRADLNVPLHNGTIVDDYRLKAVQPTIDLILKKGGRIFLITHLGRPTNQEANLSTRVLLPWLTAHDYPFTFTNSIDEARAVLESGTHVLFENIRFFPAEKASDNTFAKSLASLADFYVNDAFATMHRTDASIVLVPLFFPSEKRTIGLLVQLDLPT